ncbi:uncharacterized protein Triagg1_4898 [Trichoderma aggressivum f. europaeum]|uniref:Uncharacterized protein n=1 Tax=Trichoderma aggressivum f. europaeum TaxID=173218 RepID=A0AAE1M0U0_9HYPO|nr:hypothetical protein Triagg1_4898 [Trichoderma aggressivum f. europaeum]
MDHHHHRWLDWLISRTARPGQPCGGLGQMRCEERALDAAIASSPSLNQINQLAAGRVGTPQWMTAWLSSALQAEGHRNAVAALALGELAEATARSTPTAAAASPPLAGPHTVRGPATATAATAASSPGLTFAPRIHPLPNNFFFPCSFTRRSHHPSSPNLVTVFVFFPAQITAPGVDSLSPRPTLGERDAIRLQTALNPSPPPIHLIQSAA